MDSSRKTLSTSLLFDMIHREDQCSFILYSLIERIQVSARRKQSLIFQCNLERPNNSVYFLAIGVTLGKLNAEWYTILQEVNGILRGQGCLASHVSVKNARFSRNSRDNGRAFRVNGNKNGGNETPSICVKRTADS